MVQERRVPPSGGRKRERERVKETTSTIPKAVDTKLVSRPRIHAETTQGAGGARRRAGEGGVDCLPSEWKFWRLRVAALHGAEWYLPNRHGANSIHQRPYTRQPWLYELLA